MDKNKCKHRTIALDDDRQIITCCDCEQQLSAYLMLRQVLFKEEKKDNLCSEAKIKVGEVIIK